MWVEKGDGKNREDDLVEVPTGDLEQDGAECKVAPVDEFPLLVGVVRREAEALEYQVLGDGGFVEE